MHHDSSGLACQFAYEYERPGMNTTPISSMWPAREMKPLQHAMNTQAGIFFGLILLRETCWRIEGQDNPINGANHIIGFGCQYSSSIWVMSPRQSSLSWLRDTDANTIYEFYVYGVLNKTGSREIHLTNLPSFPTHIIDFADRIFILPR